MTSGRRVHERFATELPVAILHEGREIPGTTRNMSMGGALIAVAEAPPFGADVKVRVHLPPLKEDATFDAVVRWVAKDSVGVQFGSLRAKEVWALNQMFRDMPSV